MLKPISPNKEKMVDTLIKDERVITAEQLQGQPHAKILALAEIIPFLASPDSGKPLRLQEDKPGLTDDDHNYPIVDGTPVLYPACISKAFLGRGLQLKYYDDSELQYFLLSQIKQRGEINAASTNVHYQRHLFRMKEFLKDCRGTVLDVGCNNVHISASLFNKHCDYIGLDPLHSSKSDFRIIGVGEFLPICDESIDNVVFNTSLDHILDYHQALEEAQRVLKPGGYLFLATLIWTASASLLNDLVHFHHFREYEISGSLNGMHIEQVKHYQYKDDQHRYGLYISASKQ
jgi:SAM-dependent methyltransferase